MLKANVLEINFDCLNIKTQEQKKFLMFSFLMDNVLLVGWWNS